ncbi:uncharacterized protein B0I36DRAFT_352385 [Microdochium trichocladiopsis]|uniref:Uncharacterized protein n=1 Tax=Microdochium trichocladiopsis TaxID=1682393 RepID=A0A9P9BMR4_9PEZI|nr:uncharacterized protein B0I36DRAFT_352385 [Microdochium trichocladiopsis]KAH7026545.1 hypothetical protein B0I36DRAFT_352385 [Microdochium trichocladiopsis]
MARVATFSDPHFPPTLVTYLCSCAAALFALPTSQPPSESSIARSGYASFCAPRGSPPPPHCSACAVVSCGAELTTARLCASVCVGQLRFAVRLPCEWVAAHAALGVRMVIPRR